MPGHRAKVQQGINVQMGHGEIMLVPHELGGSWMEVHQMWPDLKPWPHRGVATAVMCYRDTLRRTFHARSAAIGWTYMECRQQNNASWGAFDVLKLLWEAGQQHILTLCCS